MDAEYIKHCAAYARYDAIASQATTKYNEARMNAIAKGTQRSMDEARCAKAAMDHAFHLLDRTSRSQIRNRLTYTELKRVWNM